MCLRSCGVTCGTSDSMTAFANHPEEGWGRLGWLPSSPGHSNASGVRVLPEGIISWLGCRRQRATRIELDLAPRAISQTTTAAATTATVGGQAATRL